MDRIDLQIEVPLISPWVLGQLGPSEKSSVVLGRVLKAREFQKQRGQTVLNSTLDGTQLEQTAQLSSEGRQFLISSAEKINLSGRGFHRMIRLARTIADMAFSPEILKEHVAQALMLRLPERK